MNWKLKSTLVCTVALLAVLLATTAVGRGRSVRYANARYLAKKHGLGRRLAATLMFNGGFPPKWVAVAGGDEPPSYLQWPIPGHHLGRGFGSDNGRHLAVDVTADIGTSVQAMAPGIVGYADNGVRGYGNMVMLLHPGGFVTLYAHLDRFRVIPGQRIKRRQVIALSGNTGLSRGPHLHFALVVRGKPKDPMRFMRGVPKRRMRVSMYPIYF